MSVENRPAAAATGEAAARTSQQAVANGVWGMALFLCAEVALFGTLIGSYFYLNASDRAWPPDHISAPAVLAPTLATVVLVLTLVPIHLARRACRQGRRQQTIVAIAAAMVLQGGYLGWQIVLLAQNLRQFSPQGSAYGSIYYTLLVVHHAHVALGLALDAGIIWQLIARGLTRYWRTAVTNLAMYWSVICAIAVVVLLTQISPSL